MLYNFSKLSKKLDEWGFPSLNSESGFQIIKGVDFEKAYKAGSISFKDDGIYLEFEGKEYRGFMYIKEYSVSRYKTFPKFHLHNCETIAKFIEAGRFKQRYEWSNSNVNDVIDNQTKELYKDRILSYCKNCIKLEYDEGFRDAQGFFDTLDKSELDSDQVEVGIMGYVRDKEKISKAYRTKMNFTCESCKISRKKIIHGRYWHTHHKDGDKLNNKVSNLECQCIVCHCYKDQRHQDNFEVKRWQGELATFVKLYRSELNNVNNPHLKKYDLRA